jgi:hypothetical protein
VKRVRDKARFARANRHEALKTCMPQGHPDYRFICQEMWHKIKEVHPALGRSGKIHRLAKIPFRASAIRDADGVQEIGSGEVADD